VKVGVENSGSLGIGKKGMSTAWIVTPAMGPGLLGSDVIKRAQGYPAGSDGIKHFQQVNMKGAERHLGTDASSSAAPKALRRLSV
jgi:hypothetical protein